MESLIRSQFFWVWPIAAFLLLVGFSLTGNWLALDAHARGLALERGRSMFGLLEMARLWNSKHGGVYVPVTERTQPNPYLEVKDRDVMTTDGVLLTKINPAFMTRMISEVARENSGIRIKATSLELLNPNNAPDAWEKESLEAFARGTTEVLALGGTSPARSYRYMSRLLVKKECLQCHEKQGYRVGDVRGGISVTLDAEPLLALETTAKRNAVAVHLGAFVVLSLSTVYLLSRLRRQWRALRDTKDRLAEREEFSSRLTASMGEACVAIDADGKITFANDEASRVLGWTREELVGDAYRERLRLRSVSDAARSEVHDPIAVMLATGETFRADDAAYEHRDGHVFPVEHVGTPFVVDGAIVGGVVLLRDITLRKSMEQQLVRGETLMALGSMVAGVAHEINTPLGIAVTAASHLVEKTDPVLASFDAGQVRKSELAEYLATAKQSSSLMLSNLERAAHLVRSFKLVAADRASESRQRFELPRYLEDVLTTLRPMLRKAGHQLELSCPETIEMNSFPGALSQVVTNLVSNSNIHAFEPGEVGHLRVDVARDRDRVTLLYSDDGRGIPPEIRARVFEPFFTTRRHDGCTGLGLHIVHNLVTEVLKGTLELRAGQTRGATFAVSIPAEPA